jgi:predicted nuclease of predicted toxin-antitoxin system
MRFVADEMIPRMVVESLQAAGSDVVWIASSGPGTEDPVILRSAGAEGRVLLTRDKDFGALIYRQRLDPGAGVVLFRLRGSLKQVCDMMVQTILSRTDWAGHYCVVTNDKIRRRPLLGVSDEEWP